jgi:hypothetical protein
MRRTAAVSATAAAVAPALARLNALPAWGPLATTAAIGVHRRPRHAEPAAHLLLGAAVCLALSRLARTTGTHVE